MRSVPRDPLAPPPLRPIAEQRSEHCSSERPLTRLRRLLAPGGAATEVRPDGLWAGRRELLPLLAAALGLVAGGAALAAGAAGMPRLVVSIDQLTLRMETGTSRRSLVFPVGLGRWEDGALQGPAGTLFTGPDPRDRERYIPRRWLPAFHRGLPFLRLVTTRRHENGPLWAIHGPVTPTLIWGRVSRGCVRLQPGALARVYAFAVRHPGLPVAFRRDDGSGGRNPEPDAVRPAVRGCPEAAVGARRLRRLSVGRVEAGRICGGVDHWWALELAGGDSLAAHLRHGGALRVELYGIRAISPVAAGVHGLEHRVPEARNNRGDRFLRIVAPAAGVHSYSLEVTMARGRDRQ